VKIEKIDRLKNENRIFSQTQKDELEIVKKAATFP